MNGRTPHIVQYQGSKRLLAPTILKSMPNRFNRLIEPFSGMAAITIATATENRAENYHINDLNVPLVEVLRKAINEPECLLNKYTNVWNEQFSYEKGHVEHFYYVREKFNEGNQTEENMLYLLARCVKGAVRYDRNGKFNQSPDKRRHGTNPRNLEKNIFKISKLLKNKTTFSAVDYQVILDEAQPGDLVYMDPPYQGTSGGSDTRYISGLGYDEFTKAIHSLDKKGVDYIISYDGICGDKEYGLSLPSYLNCSKTLINAGLSSQSTLLGRKDITLESLYVSDSLKDQLSNINEQISLLEYAL